jgi:hypothetical protein
MTTYHAIERTQERAGYNTERSKKFIANAIKRGQSANSFNSTEREYLQHLERKAGCRVIAYNSFCFIINKNGICVTMWALPNWFGRKIHCSGKKVIRDTRKYTLRYVEPDHEDEWMSYQAA